MSSDYKTFDCYKILSISRTATPQEIRNAYLKKSKEHHPDVGGSNEQQVRVNIAYSILSNPLEREQHDRYWNNVYNEEHTTKSNSKHSGHYSKQSRVSSIQQLFNRVASVFDQALTNLKNEKEKWIKTKVSTYKNKIFQWRQEQENLFQQKRVKFEDKFIKMRDKQIGLYKYNIAKNNTRYLRKSKFKKPLFYFAIILSIVTLVFLIPSVYILIFSIEPWLKIFTILITVTAFFMTGIFWFWHIVNSLTIIDFNFISINDPNYHKRIKKVLFNKFLNKGILVENQKILAGDSDGVSKIHKILHNKLLEKTININGEKISYSINEWLNKIIDIARQEAESTFYEKEKNIKLKRERYLQYVAEIDNLAGRSTTFDTSEEQVARRIAVTFFLMGYLPVHYNNQTRVLVFNDGTENIIIRFRHRPGNPTNISYVKDMKRIMLASNSKRGFLFCSPGLSQNAAQYSQDNGITWYSLEAMNKWIDNVLSSDYFGPAGNILNHTDTMIMFLRQITLTLKNK